VCKSRPMAVTESRGGGSPVDVGLRSTGPVTVVPIPSRRVLEASILPVPALAVVGLGRGSNPVTKVQKYRVLARVETVPERVVAAVAIASASADTGQQSREHPRFPPLPYHWTLALWQAMPNTRLVFCGYGEFDCREIVTCGATRHGLSDDPVSVEPVSGR